MNKILIEQAWEGSYGIGLSGFGDSSKRGYVLYPECMEPVHDVPDTMLKIAVRTIDRDIGILLIQWDPLVVHIAKALARDQDNSPCRDIIESPDHFLKGDIQVYDNAILFEVVHRFPTVHNTATRGNNCVVAVK